ncbi:SpaA isopeptide-forming pilin-related protein [Bacillus sp. BP-3]|uniref:SpaA isopeptide-forming pilin-related protein n=1 Tax=Bacillus sp. BP-3 TaxID=3022773 RepID=UPI00232CEEA3|nr:SpaA isopeptide-forming pilin-related protein [Bacillus sp. BP-3]MDC2865193.1 SpaA isopeptide-forming pilin-related protein [Bacillus sp. BP-3]
MKQKMLAKWVCMLSVLIMLLGVSVPQVKAEVIHRENYQMNWSYSKSKDKEIKAALFKTGSGNVAYCLILGLRTPNGEDLPEMGNASDPVYRILLHGYPQKTPAELGVSTPAEAHYATQLAIWIAMGQLQVDDLIPKNQNVHTLMKQLVEKSKDESESQKIVFNVNPADPQTAKQNGDYLETGLYTIQTNAISGTYTVQTENAPQGTQILNGNGEKKTTFSINEKFKILIPKNTPSGDFKFRLKSTLTNLQAIAFDGGNIVQNIGVLLQRNSENMSTDLVVNWETLGSLQIMKLGEKKQPLKGAVFEVSSEKSDIKKNITTNDQGIAELHQLPIGTYIVKEIQAPDGYILDTTAKKIEVKTGETALLEVKNENIHGQLEISKVDSADNNKKLPNAEFTIYDIQGKEVAKGKTNQNGTAIFKLPYGKYTYKETLAPDGYVINDETFSFEIKDDGQIIKHTVKDKKISGELIISKVDSANNDTKLPNAEFTIYDIQGKEIAKGKTDQNGTATFKLPYGKYTYKETLAPDGYVINDETFSFEIKEDGQIIKHTVKDQKKQTAGTPNQPQPPNNEISKNTQLIDKPIRKNTRYLPSTGMKLPSLLLFGIGFIIAGGYLLKMRQKV